MKIIIGLGNPGKDYENTKHNLGFMFINYLQNRYNLDKLKGFKNSKIIETNINNQKVVLACPQTYMNLSGKAVVELKNWYKVENEDILIIYDDIDISFGDVRFREKGSSGTHNGMRDITNKLGSNDVPRLRIGTGGIKKEREELISFVLSKFSKEQIKEIDCIFDKAYLKLEEFLDKTNN